MVAVCLSMTQWLTQHHSVQTISHQGAHYVGRFQMSVSTVMVDIVLLACVKAGLIMTA